MKRQVGPVRIVQRHAYDLWELEAETWVAPPVGEAITIEVAGEYSVGLVVSREDDSMFMLLDIGEHDTLLSEVDDVINDGFERASALA